MSLVNGKALFGKNSNSRIAAKLVGRNAFASLEHRIEGRRVRIGSAEGNDLILPHRTVSARHAVIRESLGRYYIRDLGSTNGTWLNGNRIESEQPLRPGDELRFGAARIGIVAAEKPRSFTRRIFGGALGALMLVALGYLAYKFIGNWETIQPPYANAPSASSSMATNEIPRAASTAASEARIIPLPPRAGSNPPATTGEPAWLATVNQYRAAVNLPPVAEDAQLSAADRKHAMYIVKNFEDKVGPAHLITAQLHEEEKGNPWYTPEGQRAGEQSDVNQEWGRDKPHSPTWAIDNWLSGPFHRLWILNPRLHRVGYGEFCEKQYCVAALYLGEGMAAVRGPSRSRRRSNFRPTDRSPR